MKGLWSLSVHLIGTSFKGSYELGRIIIDIIFFVAIIYACIRQPARYKIRGAYSWIIYGANILLVWYILTLIDLFLHESRLKTTYGYILLEWFIAIFKVAADVSIVTGAVRVISGQLFYLVKKAKAWLLVGEFFIIMLMVTALYYLGSLLADEVLWLQVADPDVVGGVTARKNKFETAFVMIQFLLTLMALVEAAWSVWIHRKDGNEVPKILQLAYLTFCATAFLWIRSFSESVIVIRYDLLHNPMPKGTPIARDFIYGLCTSVFLFLFSQVGEDVLTQETNQPVHAQIEEDSRQYLIDVVDNAAANKQPLPALSGVIENMKHNPRTVLSDSAINSINNVSPMERNRLQAAHSNYLDKLDEKFGNVAPVDRTREY